MAAIASQHSQPAINGASDKAFAEFSVLKDAPSLESDSLPTIDFSLLTSSNRDQRSKALHDFRKALAEWGFVILENHGIPEDLMKKMLEVTREFFSLPEDEKLKCKATDVADRLKRGNYNTIGTSYPNFRESLRLIVHPEFHCPLRPPTMRDILSDYSERIRKLSRTLLEAIAEVLEVNQGYMEEELKLDSMSQVFNVNFYPPCPNPDKTVGLVPHTDHGLFTTLIHNGVPGLQFERNGQWFTVNSPENTIVMNTANQLEIFSNGRFKAMRHRAVVNAETTRMSIVIGNGPSPDAILGPASQLVQKDGCALLSLDEVRRISSLSSDRGSTYTENPRNVTCQDGL